MFISISAGQGRFPVPCAYGAAAGSGTGPCRVPWCHIERARAGTTQPPAERSPPGARTYCLLRPARKPGHRPRARAPGSEIRAQAREERTARLVERAERLAILAV